MLKVIDGDLLCATENILGHQVNSQGKMNSGVAKFIRKKYPKVFDEYYKLCNNENKENLLGKCQCIICDDDKVVANLFGQSDYGYDGRQYTSVKDLRKALVILKDIAMELHYSVALPYKIGSCRGGADWNEVYMMIEEVFNDYAVTLYRLDLG